MVLNMDDMKRVYRRPIKQMPQWGVWVVPMVAMFVVFLIGFACVASEWVETYLLVCLPFVILISAVRGMKLFYNQYYVELWEDRMVFVHVIRHSVRKEFLFASIESCELRAYRGLDRTYGLTVRRKDGGKYRYLVDSVNPADFKDIVRVLHEFGVAVGTDLEFGD